MEITVACFYYKQKYSESSYATQLNFNRFEIWFSCAISDNLNSPIIYSSNNLMNASANLQKKWLN